MALYICQVLHIVDFLGSGRMETAPTSIEVLLHPTQSQSDEPSDLRGSLSPTSVYSTWQSQAVTHPIINRAQRCLTEQTLMIKVPFKSNNAFNSTMMASFLPVNTLVFIILAVIDILSKKNKQTENNRPRPRARPMSFIAVSHKFK